MTFPTNFDSFFQSNELQRIYKNANDCNSRQYVLIGDGQLNLGMEYVSTNMERVIRWYAATGRTVSADYGRLYAYQLFRALAYMHGTARLCHRDVKPRNLLLHPAAGTLKLCDFGGSKNLRDGRPNAWYVCSRRYRAPELLFAGHHGPAAVCRGYTIAGYSTAVDVWSAGCVYAELMTGAQAYPGTGLTDQRALVARGPPKLPATTPADVVRLIVAALRLDPASRPTAQQACGHGCFDVLRRPDVRLADGRRLPPLFDDGDGGAPPRSLGEDGDRPTTDPSGAEFYRRRPADAPKHDGGGGGVKRRPVRNRGYDHPYGHRHRF